MQIIPEILLKKADELEKKTKRYYPKLASLVKQCFLNTIETTVTQLDDGSFFVITGDIPAMWLRDSAAQVKPYIQYAAEDETLRKILRSIIEKHAFYVTLDPYSNAFNAADSGVIFGYKDHTDFENGYIWERKYEVDSLCASLYLAHDYYMATKDRAIFTDSLHEMIRVIVKTFTEQQDHAKTSYFFSREDCPESDTLTNDGHGAPVNPETGMTWSGFRPSDDACKYGYLIPSNMMAVVALSYAAELADAGWQDMELASRCHALAAQINAGIEKYGIVDHPKYGKIYAYETDGFGNYNLMDDANSPSLLSLPYLGYCEANDPIYQNTRRFILSGDNPYYYEGTAAKGIGSPHTPKNYIWHISLCMQALTSTDEEEVRYCMDTIANTHAGTNFMHEGFDVNDPSKFTREWFAWANTLFAQTVDTLVNR